LYKYCNLYLRYIVAAITVLDHGHDIAYIKVNSSWFVYDGMRERRFEETDELQMKNAQHLYLVEKDSASARNI